MGHDPLTVAAYVAGELLGDQVDAFERHLLVCDVCWAEVRVARRGQALAKVVAEPAPASLRRRVTAVACAAGPLRVRGRAGLSRRQAVAVLVTTAVVVLGGSAGLVVLADRTGSRPVDAAVSDFRSGRMPGTRFPAGVSPDLTSLRLVKISATAGGLDGMPVSGYAYRDRAGHRLLVYLADRPFPAPGGAVPYEGAGSWVVRRAGVVVLYGSGRRNALVVGEDEQTVRAVGELLEES